MGFTEAVRAKLGWSGASNIMKYCQFVSSILMTINFIVRLVYMGSIRNFGAFMITFLIPFLSAVAVGVELDKFNLREVFFFLNYGWGKGVYSWLWFFLLLGAGSTDPNSNDAVTSIFLFAFGLILPAISFIYHDDELAFVKEKIDAL